MEQRVQGTQTESGKDEMPKGNGDGTLRVSWRDRNGWSGKDEMPKGNGDPRWWSTSSAHRGTVGKG
ncbi:protein of unknown function [Methylacidimicrobium sp. AP8]|nr:protein of unknown function [Methylacidimicrobium sp. AP8]